MAFRSTSDWLRHSKLLEAVLGYADLGWRVFPIRCPVWDESENPNERRNMQSLATKENDASYELAPLHCGDHQSANWFAGMMFT